MLLIYKDELIDDEIIKEMEKTPEGLRVISQLKISTRVAFAADHIHGYLKNELKALGRELSYEEREMMCNIMYQCLLKMDQTYVDQYVMDVYEHLKEHKFQMPTIMGHC